MASNRLKDYKNRAGGVDDLRKRRGEETVQIRKAKRDEELLKRRNIQQPAHAQSGDGEDEEAMEVATPAIQDVDLIRRGLLSTDVDELYAAARSCRLMVSTSDDSGIDLLVKSSVVPVLVNVLAQQDPPLPLHILLEVVWSVMNIASGSSVHTASVVTAGGIPALIRLLAATSADPTVVSIVENALWALGNIAGDDYEQFLCRNLLLSADVVPAVMSVLSVYGQHMSLVRNAIWLLSNLCRSKSHPADFSLIRPLLPALVHFMQHGDEDTMVQACRAVDYLASGKSDQPKVELLQLGVANPLVQNMSFSKVIIVLYAVRSVGNFLKGDDHQTQVVLDAGALPSLRHLLSCKHNQICKDALWAVSNVTAGNRQQLQMLIDARVLPKVVKLVLHGNQDLVKEALWSISNVLHGGSKEQIRYMASLNCHTPLARVLQTAGPDEVCLALDVLGRFLRLEAALKSKQAKPSPPGTDFATSFAECGGVDVLWKLGSSPNDRISELADQLVTRFFGESG